MTVVPDDYIYADASGALVIPAASIDDVMTRAVAIEKRDAVSTAASRAETPPRCCAREAHAVARRRRSAWSIAVCAVWASLAGANPATATLGEALDHLAGRHDPHTGGFDGRAPARQRAADAAWAALAIRAAGEDPATWRRTGSPSLAEAVSATAPRGLGAVERTIVAMSAVGLDPRHAGQRDLVQELLAAQEPGGSFGGTNLLNAWGVIALRAAGVAPKDAALTRAVAALRAGRATSGGWSFTPDRKADVPTTATAVQALVSAGVSSSDPDLAAARGMLRGARRRDGGFPPLPLRASTALDTAWGAVAIRALGENPAAAPWTRGQRGPLRFLEVRQGADGGVADRVGQLPGVLVTSVAALAFAGHPLPLVAAGGTPRPDRAPRIVARTPAAGDARGPLVFVRYRDAPGGTGVDVASVRLVADGRDVTRLARITRYTLQIAGSDLGTGPVSLALTLKDAAGNTRVEKWGLGPPR